jgi:hypothetical protein
VGTRSTLARNPSSHEGPPCCSVFESAEEVDRICRRASSGRTGECRHSRQHESSRGGIALSDGCRCVTCEYVCSSEDSMVVHCRTQHNWVKACGMGWEVGKVQTLFQGNHKKYFIVRLHTIEAPKQPVDDWMLGCCDGRRSRMQRRMNDWELWMPINICWTSHYGCGGLGGYGSSLERI